MTEDGQHEESSSVDSDEENVDPETTVNPVSLSVRDTDPTLFNGPATSVKDLPKIKDKIMYKTSDHDEWVTGTVESRGGKVGGRHWHFLNVRPMDSDEAAYVSFRDQVIEWKNANSAESSIIADQDNSESAHFIYLGNHAASSKFSEAKE